MLQIGSDTATPEFTNGTGVAGPCTPGHYCPQQSSTPTPCPLGTYSNTTKLTADSECLDCPYGMYCGELGLTEPSGPCSPGFYCLLGSESPNNAVEDATGNISFLTVFELQLSILQQYCMFIFLVLYCRWTLSYWSLLS